MTCEGDVRRVYKGGVYHPTLSVFQRLDDEGIHVVFFFEILPLPSNIRLWMFLRRNELTNRHWSRAMGGTPHTAERECGLERTGIRGAVLFRYRWWFKQIGKYHDDLSPDD